VRWLKSRFPKNDRDPNTRTRVAAGPGQLDLVGLRAVDVLRCRGTRALLPFFCQLTSAPSKSVTVSAKLFDIVGRQPFRILAALKRIDLPPVRAIKGLDLGQPWIVASLRIERGGAPSVRTAAQIGRPGKSTCPEFSVTS